MTPGNELPSFGALLKDFRTRQHLTQQQLAEALGMHRDAIGRWERGDFLPASKTIVLEVARHLYLDEVKTRALLEASLTALSPHWLVPLPRNPYFTGREEILRALHASLASSRMVTHTQAYALHGLGGVGKTQLALEYAYRHALDYSGVFWIASETAESVVSSLLEMAAVLRLPGLHPADQRTVIASVQRWLTTHSHWLLIWDNADDLELLQRFLPPARHGAILLTTRTPTLGTLARGIALSPLESDEAALFLLRRAKLLAPEATQEQLRQLEARLPSQVRAAADVVAETGGLPLALDQAGAYVEAAQCSLSAYLELFRARREVLLQQRGTGGCDHPTPVSTTFSLAIAAGAARHPALWDLLRLSAVLQAEAIPEELFRRGAEHLGSMLSSTGGDGLEWDRLIAVACSYSLVSRQPEAQTLSLHRLVQAVVRDSMSEAEQAQWNWRAVAALEAVFPAVPSERDSAYWTQGERLLPHALVCLQAIPVAGDALVAASLAYKVAECLRAHAHLHDAELLCRRALRLREHALGPDHLDVATTLNCLGAICVEQGCFQEAAPLYQRALHIREQALGSERPEIAGSLNNLALLYWSRGEYAEAETLYCRALCLLDCPDNLNLSMVARVLNNWAHLCRDQGKHAEAEKQYRRALSLWNQVFGSDSLMLAEPLTGLGHCRREQGRFEEAEALYRRALHLREQALGPEHPDLAYSLDGLANLYRGQGRYTEAEALYQRALHNREQALGPSHPDLAWTLHDLAICRQLQGRLHDALILADRALQISRAHLGDGHPKTIALAANRALSLRLRQECNGAEATGEVVHGGRQAAGVAYSAPILPGLAVGQAVVESGSFQKFLEARCEFHPDAWCRSSGLWQAYVRWVEEHQERYPLSRRALSALLKIRGCHADRTNRARIWRGVAVRSQET